MFFYCFFVLSSTAIEKLEIEKQNLDMIRKDLNLLKEKQEKILSRCESLYVDENFLRLKILQMDLQKTMILLQKNEENLKDILSESKEINENINSTEEKPKFISKKMYSFIRETY